MNVTHAILLVFLVRFWLVVAEDSTEEKVIENAAGASSHSVFHNVLGKAELTSFLEGRYESGVLLTVGSHWCQHCRRMNRTILNTIAYIHGGPLETGRIQPLGSSSTRLPSGTQVIEPSKLVGKYGDSLRKIEFGFVDSNSEANEEILEMLGVELLPTTVWVHKSSNNYMTYTGGINELSLLNWLSRQVSGDELLKISSSDELESLLSEMFGLSVVVVYPETSTDRKLKCMKIVREIQRIFLHIPVYVIEDGVSTFGESIFDKFEMSVNPEVCNINIRCIISSGRYWQYMQYGGGEAGTSALSDVIEFIRSRQYGRVVRASYDTFQYILSGDKPVLLGIVNNRQSESSAYQILSDVATSSNGSIIVAYAETESSADRRLLDFFGLWSAVTRFNPYTTLSLDFPTSLLYLVPSVPIPLVPDPLSMGNYTSNEPYLASRLFDTKALFIKFGLFGFPDTTKCSQWTSIRDPQIILSQISDVSKLTPATWKSDETPLSQPGPLWVVTAQTMNEFVYDNKHQQDVFLFFHSPWCAHCQRFYQDVTELAHQWKNVGSMLFASYDLQNNEVPPLPPSWNVTANVDLSKSSKRFPKSSYSGGYTNILVPEIPALVLFPREKTAPILYDGERNAKAMSDFLEIHRSPLNTKLQRANTEL